MMSRLFCLSWILGIGISTCMAQDIHWSQSFANPIAQNPANTGFFTGVYRIGLNARTQWNSVSNNGYNTVQVWFDKNTFRLSSNRASNKRQGTSPYVGFGVFCFSDRAGDGALSTFKAFGNLAAHVPIYDNPKLLISVGFSLGMSHKSIDYTNLRWDDQWNGRIIDPDLPTQQVMPENAFNGINANLGASLKLVENLRFAELGYSIQNIIQARDGFIDSENTIHKRHLIHASWKRLYKESNFSYELHGQFQSQIKARELIFSALLNQQSISDAVEAVHYGASFEMLKMLF